MEQTVELVNQWAEFKKGHPRADLQDFCKYYLTRERGKEVLPEAAKAPYPDIILTKFIDRISRIHMEYIGMAIKVLRIKQFEEFSLLSAIDNLKGPSKTEAIQYSIIEVSTGLKLLGTLKKKRYITEIDDPTDKRSKRVKITEEGRKVLFSCYERFSRIPEILFMDMKKEDI